MSKLASVRTSVPLQADGGLTYLPFVVVPLALLGGVGVLVAGGRYVESRGNSLTPARAEGVAVGAALFVTVATRSVTFVRAWEVELVALGAASLYPLGVAVRERDVRWSVAPSGAAAALLYGTTRVFANTYDEVIPLPLGAGLLPFAIGYWLSG